jgi:hypothetical protein
MKTLFIFGSKDFSFDNGAVKLASHIKKELPRWTIKKLIRPDQLMENIGEDFVILDVAEGIDKPTLITDLENIEYQSKITAHDLDLASFLKILKSVGQLHNINIIAIPNNKAPDKKEIVRLIKECA